MQQALSFIIDTDRSHDFVILVLFYAMENRNDPSKNGLVRMCIFVISVDHAAESNFGKSLNRRFESQKRFQQAFASQISMAPMRTT